MISKRINTLLQGPNTDIPPGCVHLVNPRTKSVVNCLRERDHSAHPVEQQSAALVRQIRVPIIKCINPNPDAIYLKTVDFPTELPRFFFEPRYSTLRAADHRCCSVDQFQITMMASVHGVRDSHFPDCEPTVEPTVPFAVLEANVDRTPSAVDQMLQ
jgi:hypothetical protein